MMFQKSQPPLPPSHPAPLQGHPLATASPVNHSAVATMRQPPHPDHHHNHHHHSQHSHHHPHPVRLSTTTSPALGLGVPLLLLLTALPREVTSTCQFPDFMTSRESPWAASYGVGSQLIMYVKDTYMTVSQQVDHKETKYIRKCEKRAPDNKFVVTHEEDPQEPKYLCMQFLQRSENIVQMKVSELHDRQVPELCDERRMAVDRWPIVQMSQTPEQKITCPFMGGYNVNMYYPNDTALCTDPMLLMRIESECEDGEGIVFNFRQEECVPASLPRNVKQQAYCIAHWTQGSQTFVILQHSVVHKQTWCLRISDPLSDIHSAHLMLDLVCDTGDVIRDTKNYFRIRMDRRVYASTCEDEIETDVCNDMKHLCNSVYKDHCARTCGTCRSESEIGDCAFEETYRGTWAESSAVGGDTKLTVEAYSLYMQRLGRYDCLSMEDSKAHKDKRVLVRIDEHGCYPRYTCVEMDKISSSVMRFRLGDRHQWPLPQTGDRKDHICAAENFVSRDEVESRFHVQRPARLLVKESSINRVHCGLPKRLQNGIAFREEGVSCSGCLMYRPSVAHDRFLVRPHNCSMGGKVTGPAYPQQQQQLSTINYSCLASFTFHNNSHAVVTKTNTYNSWGEYLCWVFTPDNYIKVIKAAETFRFEEEEFVKPDQLEAQFTIIKDDRGDRCSNVIAIAPPPSREESNNNNNRHQHDTLRPYPPEWHGNGVGGGRGPSTRGPGGERPHDSTYRPDKAVTYRVSTRGPDTQVEGPDTVGLGQAMGNNGASSGARAALHRTSTTTTTTAPTTFAAAISGGLLSPLVVTVLMGIVVAAFGMAAGVGGVGIGVEEMEARVAGAAAAAAPQR